MRPERRRNAQPQEPAAKDLGGQVLWQCRELGHAQEETPVAGLGQPGELEGGARREPRDGPAGDGGGATQDLDDVGIVALAEERQHVVPDPVPQEAAIAVAPILAPREPMGAEVGLDLPPMRLEQRPDVRATRRGNPRESPRAGALEETHADRLGLIVGGVGGGDPGGADLPRPRGEGRVPDTPRGRLEPALARRIPRHSHVNALDMRGNRPAPAEPEDEARVGVRLGAETVMHVDDVERQREHRPEETERGEQGHRVGAPGHGHEHRVAAPEETVAADGGEDAVREAPWRRQPVRPTHTSPSSKCSFFQIGTVSLRVSMAKWQASKASRRCAEETAMSTLDPPISSRPTRCTRATFRTPAFRACTAAAISCILAVAMAAWPSYSRNLTRRPPVSSRTTPEKRTMAPAPGSSTACTSAR